MSRVIFFQQAPRQFVFPCPSLQTGPLVREGPWHTASRPRQQLSSYIAGRRCRHLQRQHTASFCGRWRSVWSKQAQRATTAVTHSCHNFPSRKNVSPTSCESRVTAATCKSLAARRASSASLYLPCICQICDMWLSQALWALALARVRREESCAPHTSTPWNNRGGLPRAPSLAARTHHGRCVLLLSGASSAP